MVTHVPVTCIDTREPLSKIFGKVVISSLCRVESVQSQANRKLNTVVLTVESLFRMIDTINLLRSIRADYMYMYLACFTVGVPPSMNSTTHSKEAGTCT